MSSNHKDPIFLSTSGRGSRGRLHREHGDSLLVFWETTGGALIAAPDGDVNVGEHDDTAFESYDTACPRRM